MSTPVHAFPVVDPGVLAIAVCLICFVALCIIAGWIRRAGARAAVGLTATNPLGICLTACLGGKVEFFDESPLVEIRCDVADEGDNASEGDAD